MRLLACMLLLSAAVACSSTTETGDSSGGGAGSSGGCTVTSECATGEFCEFPDGMCGAGQTGACTERPMACSDGDFYCGCDGNTYMSDCAQNSGVDVNDDSSACTAPTDYIPCGEKFCDVLNTYCQRSVSDVSSEPDGYGCRVLPGTCPQPADCACLAAEPCNTFCEVTGDGLTITCPGG